MIEQSIVPDGASVAELAAREAQRCAALLQARPDVLEAMLADDLVHIHLNGKTDDKPAYMDAMRHGYAFRDLTRGDLNIRCYGDFAVMTGPLSQTLEVLATGDILKFDAVTTQTWIRLDGVWLLNTCHNAPVPV
ncbi:nuclear transport factor 2 family protein [Mesobacterium pallidum]|uniref:nuclear transport factor 2 family protein n=1 Tax=Mesobacterium pallidum TaxID=2872037 RepID=UPI001EE2156E|nr:nuclear transport factor 2 family protein [Mesobacterium pallidum]